MNFVKPMLAKIIAAGPGRKTRLHDEKGNLIGFRRLAFNAPRAISTGLLRIVLNYRPEIPWISYDAVGVLEKFLNKTSRVLEFGSGMSTIWYAKHAGEVCSVEESRLWYEKVAGLIESRHLRNISLHYAEGAVEYSQFMAGDSVGFDLIMVDGNYRGSCATHALKLLRKRGIFYLDNSDRGVSSLDADTRLAEEVILKFAQERNADIFYFTDFAPTQFFVQQGLLIKLPD